MHGTSHQPRLSLFTERNIRHPFEFDFGCGCYKAGVTLIASLTEIYLACGF
jgi:hypothetical protein